MNGSILRRQACGLFARLLGYPGPELARTARTGAALLGAGHSQACTHLQAFCEFVEGHPATAVEEIYTATFDLQPSCIPYVGYLLFGEGRPRTLFLMQLQELYRRHGFVCGPELPDHLAEVLRFVAEVPDISVTRELIDDGLLPALAKLAAGFGEESNPYVELLKGLQAFLAGETGVIDRLAPAGRDQEVMPCEI